jgi:CRISPR system Cascade subunit CasA
MTKQSNDTPAFNLWTEPWISLEKSDGQLVQVSIQEALLNAKDYTAIYDPSPLVVVGVHRLLTAILQDALNPKENDDLEQLWKNGFPKSKIEDFGSKYADRFDLFSPDKPFLQSADLPMFPKTKEEQKGKTFAVRLFPEIPSGELISHYHHTNEDDQVLSPATVAKGLVALPPFVSSGGPGLMPSINGVPPIYVIPGGRSLFESFCASLISLEMIKDEYSADIDYLCWWKRPIPTIVEKSEKKTPNSQLSVVGYLHGMTFPARKIRLHPEILHRTCSRSGESSAWCVKTMSFKMGESLREGAFWLDPFVAYKLPIKKSASKRGANTIKSKKKKENPNPLRPTRVKTAWREFTGLFLQSNNEVRQFRRPLFLNQLALLSVSERFAVYPFRCVAFQTDGKMKFFEWMEFGFDVPTKLMQDVNGALWTEIAIDFANQCEKVITDTFTWEFCRIRDSKQRDEWLRAKLQENYWFTLAGLFRQLILDLNEPSTRKQKVDDWVALVKKEAEKSFGISADAMGDDGATLRRIVEGKDKCHKKLQFVLKQYQQKGG